MKIWKTEKKIKRLNDNQQTRTHFHNTGRKKFVDKLIKETKKQYISSRLKKKQEKTLETNGKILMIVFTAGYIFWSKNHIKRNLKLIIRGHSRKLLTISLRSKLFR